MFAELDGYGVYEAAVDALCAIGSEHLRERWREAKRRQRAALKLSGGKRRDQAVASQRRAYQKRWDTDPAFRESRRAYWRAYSRERARRNKATVTPGVSHPRTACY